MCCPAESFLAGWCGPRSLRETECESATRNAIPLACDANGLASQSRIVLDEIHTDLMIHVTLVVNDWKTMAQMLMLMG